jgi:hypothetical protein
MLGFVGYAGFKVQTNPFVKKRIAVEIEEVKNGRLRLSLRLKRRGILKRGVIKIVGKGFEKI